MLFVDPKKVQIIVTSLPRPRYTVLPIIPLYYSSPCQELRYKAMFWTKGERRKKSFFYSGKAIKTRLEVSE